jgi:hypothetical protein
MTKNNKIYIFIVAILLQTTTPNDTPEKSENGLKTIIYSCGVLHSFKLETGGVVDQQEYDQTNTFDENHEHTDACILYPGIHMIKNWKNMKKKDGRSGELAAIIAYHFRDFITNADTNLDNYIHIFATGTVDNCNKVNKIGGVLPKLIAIANYIKKNNIDINHCLIIAPQDNDYDLTIIKNLIQRYSDSLEIPHIYTTKSVIDALSTSGSFINNNKTNLTNKKTRCLKNEHYSYERSRYYFFIDYADLIEKIFINMHENTLENHFLSDDHEIQNNLLDLLFYDNFIHYIFLTKLLRKYNTLFISPYDRIKISKNQRNLFKLYDHFK